MVDTSARLKLENLLDMLRHLARIPVMFRTYRELIKKEYFLIPENGVFEYEDYQELPLMYIWQALCDYYTDQQADNAPSSEMLRHYVKERLRSGVYVTDELVNRLLDTDPEWGMIAYLYACADDDINIVTGTPLCKAFIRERSVVSKIAKLVTFQSDIVTGDLSDRLKNITEESSYLDGVGVEKKPALLMPESALAPVDSNDDDLDVQSTGIPWMNAALGGGTYKGECNGILGATGAGKTTLGVQLALGYAEASYGTSSDSIIYYTYEEPVASVWKRMVSCGCNIHRSSVDGKRMVLKNPSLTLEESKDYELDIWPRYRETEVERYRKKMSMYNNRVFIQNMSGVADYGDTQEDRRYKESRGKGGVAEIYSDAESIMRYTGQKIRAIIIDYAGLVCQRQLGERALDDGKMYAALKSFGEACRIELAGRLGCTIWVLHQLAGAVVGKGPLYRPSHADADGCKSLVNNFTNCVCLGALDKLPCDFGGPRMWACFSKTRNSAGGASDYILMHDKYFSRLVDVTKRATISRHNKSFVVSKR